MLNHKTLKRVLVFLRIVLVVDLGVSLLMSVTFLFAGPFTFTALSERIFWAGLFITVIACVVGAAALFAGRSFGIPSIIRRPEEARRLLDNFDDYRDEVEKRYDISIQMFLTGVGCIVISALIQSLLG